MATKTKNFIAGAIKHPGALTKKAKSAGKSISDYCSGGNLSTQSTRQCNFAKVLKSVRPHGKK